MEGENDGEQSQDGQLGKADDFEVSSFQWEGDYEESVNRKKKYSVLFCFLFLFPSASAFLRVYLLPVFFLSVSVSHVSPFLAPSHPDITAPVDWT